MIDIHSHILPGVDDGAPDVEASLDMARAAVSDGITTLFATPHHRNGRFENGKLDILRKTEELNEALSLQNIPLIILPGQEVRIYSEFLEDLDQGKLLTLNNLGKYILIELPSNTVPKYTNQIIYECRLKNITPIIVHPERNSEFIQNPHLLYDLVLEGALTQITASSIIGTFGKKVKSFSTKLIEHRLTHFIASDAHNISSRKFHLRESYEEIVRKFDNESIFYFRENAQCLVDNGSVLKEDPLPIKKKLLGLF